MGCCLATTADVKVTGTSCENSTIEITQSEVVFVVSDQESDQESDRESDQESDEDVTTFAVLGRDGSRESLFNDFVITYQKITNKSYQL